jgi:DNA helicase-2/ATP-dependent DNA helicase PcrA
MEANPKHSLILFYPEIPEYLDHVVFLYIRKGIKIYLFTMDSLENYETKSHWQYAYKKGLLHWYEIRFDERFADEDSFIEDGRTINQELFDYLCEQASDFNREQYEVEHLSRDSHIILKAGAGTGKTTAMINRVLYLKQMNPDLLLKNIRMVTFTNEATQTLRTRLIEKLSDYYEVTKDRKYLKWLEEAYELGISTIHSFAQNLLMSASKELGYKNELKVRSDKHRRRRLIEKWIDRFAFDHEADFQHVRYVPQYELVRLFEKAYQIARDHSLSDDEIQSLDWGEDEKGVGLLLSYLFDHVTEEFQEIKRNEGIMETEDLIRNLPDLQQTKTIQNAMVTSDLMIDEFQDTDEAQVRFIAWLIKQWKCKLFVVGDVKQSIYRFRGADYTAFDQLESYLAEAGEPVRKLSLVKNYRSSQELLDAFHSMFDRWSSSVTGFHYGNSDRLIPASNKTGEGLIRLPLDQENLKFILERLEKEKSTAVLVRTNHNVEVMVKRIEELGFFCEGIREGNFYRTLPVREFYLLVKFLTHPKVGQNRFALHRSSYGACTLSPQQVLQSFDAEKDYIEPLLQEQPDAEQWNDFLERSKTEPVLKILKEIIEKTNPAEVYRQRIYRDLRLRFPEKEAKIQKREAVVRYKEYQLNLDHLLYIIQKHFADNVLTLHMLEKFLQNRMATDNSETALSTGNHDHRIKVMNVHQAKGLEFDFVFLPMTNYSFIRNQQRFLLKKVHGRWQVGFHTKLNNHWLNNSHMVTMTHEEDEEMIGEETRLLYVALTRAKETVFASVPEAGSTSPKINRWSHLLKEGGYGFVTSSNLPSPKTIF